MRPEGLPGGSEAPHRLFRGIQDLEQFVEARDDEDLVDLGVDIGEAEFAVAASDLVVDGDQRPQGGRGEVVDVGETDQQFRLVLGLDDGGDLLADRLDVRLVEDIAIDELDLRDAVRSADAEP